MPNVPYQGVAIVAGSVSAPIGKRAAGKAIDAAMSQPITLAMPSACRVSPSMFIIPCSADFAVPKAFAPYGAFFDREVWLYLPGAVNKDTGLPCKGSAYALSVTKQADGTYHLTLPLHAFTSRRMPRDVALKMAITSEDAKAAKAAKREAAKAAKAAKLAASQASDTSPDVAS